MQLDKSRPHGVIRGNYPARFTQDGYEFDGKGKPLPGQGIRIKAEKVAEKEPGDMTIKELKLAVEMRGGEYKNRIQAEEFLTAKDVEGIEAAKAVSEDDVS